MTRKPCIYQPVTTVTTGKQHFRRPFTILPPMMTDLLSRVRAYVAKMPVAVAGQHGHDATFKVALTLVHGFGLSERDAMPILEEYSNRCSPPWSRKEIAHKLSSAAQHARSCKPRGYLRDAQRRPAPAEPPPPPRPKKKIFLCLGSSADGEVSHGVEERVAVPATGPAPEPADLDAPDPPAWLDSHMALFRVHDQIECEEDTRLLRSFVAIVSEESHRLGLAATDDEARAAALALRKDFALGLIQTPEAGRQLVPMTIEVLRRIGLWHPEDEDDPEIDEHRAADCGLGSPLLHVLHEGRDAFG